MDTTRISASSDSALLQALLDATRGIGIRGGYKPGGTSGAAIRKIIRQVRPILYPLSGTREQLDLDALAYCLERLPHGIEACTHIDITRDETPYSTFEAIPIPARREIGFRVSPESMVLVVKGGKIRILDKITLITCLYLEGDKLAHFADRNLVNWNVFKKLIHEGGQEDLLFIQLSRITGNPVEKLKEINESRYHGRLPQVIYDLGQHSIDALRNKEAEMTVTFSVDFIKSPVIADITDSWVNHLGDDLERDGYADAPLYYISGNLKSFLGVLTPCFPGKRQSNLESSYHAFEEMYEDPEAFDEFWSANEKHPAIRVRQNVVGTGIGYQVYYLDKLQQSDIEPWLAQHPSVIGKERAALVVMDYPFGDDAFYYLNDICKYFGKRLRSVGVMGRAAGFSHKEKVCIIPEAFLRQGDPQCVTLDTNHVTEDDFAGLGVDVLRGNMLTSLGTFLQTQSILEYFTSPDQSYGMCGLEMEGIHFANAFSCAAVRSWIPSDLPMHYAYYKSDNPLDEKATLAMQVNMGERILPKYAATLALLKRVLVAP